VGISEKEKAPYKFTLHVRITLVLALGVRIASDNRYSQNKSRELWLCSYRLELSVGVQGLDSDLRKSQIAGSSRPGILTKNPRRRYVRARFSFP
jgi:hypothetical protein